MSEREMQKLYSCITGIDDDIIEKAQNLRPCKKTKSKAWIKCGAIAACLAIVVCAGVIFLPQEQTNNEVDVPNRLVALPMLTIPENTSQAMGFEGYMAFDISELVNANPWSEDVVVTTLPVYKNKLTYNEQMIVSGGDFDKMREWLLVVADRLGLDTRTLTITDDVPDETTRRQVTEKLKSADGTVSDGYFNPTRLMIETDGLEIEVNQAMTAKILFDPAVALPDEYHFTYDSSYEDMSQVAEYLQTKYKDLIGIDNPQINICGGDYNIYAQQGYYIEFFDASGDNTEQIINYNFNRVAFYCDDNGKLFLARIYQPNLSQKVGDYPIITLEKARELLSNGHYITTVPYEMADMEYVKKVELVYRTSEYEACYMPYYRFYVELPEQENDKNLKTYGAYYVPAVSGEYISNMPMWDGECN